MPEFKQLENRKEAQAKRNEYMRLMDGADSLIRQASQLLDQAKALRAEARAIPLEKVEEGEE